MEAEAHALKLVVDRFADVEDHRHAQLRAGDLAEVANEQHAGRQDHQSKQDVAQRGKRTATGDAEKGVLQVERNVLSIPEPVEKPAARRFTGNMQVLDVVDRAPVSETAVTSSATAPAM